MNLKTNFFLLFCLLYGVSVQAQWSTAELSEGRYAIASARVGSKLLFAGGETDPIGATSNRVDIYDFATDSWSSMEMSVYSGKSMEAVTTGPYAVFAKSPTGLSGKVFVYDSVQDTFITLDFTERTDFTLAAVDHKIFFAGGREAGQPVSEVDVYDLETGAWSEMNLSQARTDITAKRAGDKLFFLGGTLNIGLNQLSNRVDVYDAATGAWSQFNLGEARRYIGTTVVGDTLIAAGGQPTNSLITFSQKVELINVVTEEIDGTLTLPTDNTEMIVVAVGNYFVFAGTNDPQADVYNRQTGAWTAKTLGSTIYLQAARLGESAFLVSGNSPANTKVHEFDGFFGVWTDHALSVARTEVALGTVGNKLMVAGGRTGSTPPASTRIDILTDSGLTAPFLSFTGVVGVSCSGGADGAITLVASGGNPPFQYSVDGGALQSEPTFTGLSAGLHTFTVYDDLGFTADLEFFVFEAPPLTIGFSTLQPSPGGTNGFIAASVLGGTFPYVYSWSNGSTSSTITGIGAGTYTVTVTDAAGCTLVQSVALATSSVDDPASASALELTPNPAPGRVRLALPGAAATSQSYRVEVFSSLGRRVRQLDAVRLPAEIDLEDLRAGRYLLRAGAAGAVYSGWIVLSNR